MRLRIKRLRPDAILPSYAHPGDAGLDLYSCEDYTLKPGERRLFPIGVAFEIKQGYVGLVWDKGSMAGKFGIKSMGGVLDSGFRGEVKLILLNTTDQPFEIHKGDKIAQLLIQRVERAQIEEVTELDLTSRGEGSFGSTGRR